MGTGTQLGRVRGLGTAKSGTGHWWQQRVTAISNLVLMTWFIVSLIRLPDLQYPTVVAWLQQPIAAIPLLLLIASVFYHFRLGVQVMLEDYIHHEGNKVLAMLLLNFYVVALAFTAVFSVLKIAFGAV
jgi:succinate dehydrogenase / fumarate reductase, membrane anchor subunit